MHSHLLQHCPNARTESEALQLLNVLGSRDLARRQQVNRRELYRATPTLVFTLVLRRDLGQFQRARFQSAEPIRRGRRQGRCLRSRTNRFQDKLGRLPGWGAAVACK